MKEALKNIGVGALIIGTGGAVVGGVCWAAAIRAPEAFFATIVVSMLGLLCYVVGVAARNA